MIRNGAMGSSLLVAMDVLPLRTGSSSLIPTLSIAILVRVFLTTV